MSQPQPETVPSETTPSHYTHGDRILVAIDCIVFGYDEEIGLQLLLVKRHIEPEKGKWALMGGLLKLHENLDQAAQRILHRLTGMHDVYLEELKVYSNTQRDPVERTISVTYFALINIHNYQHQITDDYEAHWFPVSDIPELIFDHTQMVQQAKERLRYKAALHPIGFELLPERFTLTQLRNLYDAIYETELDKGNFRRMILATDLLIRLKEKDKANSKKGAYFYQLNEEKYRENLTHFLSLPAGYKNFNK
ncbi:NUDIX domain-containing protein [Rhabdobacter roseus]|uniref:ADP-ribose pyrophosphatase YjhB (NUDIX family) n=1 Tax=Rhabdobacter roseus TaxID=1655419 RepID=A0A840TUX3_9BACT|nr:NUDIX domain-containing protein [Rhabdobacter roseus]MBB5283868.1 ADP-ribose pyrophosphatase YjhB (NUDIX family) [Rhabdobacter roseus]